MHPRTQLLAEGLVIVLGVLVALGVDRWVQGLDDRAREASYLEQIVANLVTDSTGLAETIQLAEDRRALAVELLAGTAESQGRERADLLRDIGRLGFWSPQAYSRETWDDLVSTGGLSLITDSQLRQALSRYYNRTEWLSGLEADWDRQLNEFEDRTRPLLPPLVRLGVFGAVPPEVASSPTLEHLRSVLSLLDAAGSLGTDLGQVVLVYGAQARLYRDLAEELDQLLALLRRAL